MVSICIKAVAPRTTTPRKRHPSGARRKLRDVFCDDGAGLLGQQVGEEELLQCRAESDPAGSSEISANAAEIMGTSPIRVAKESAATVCAHCSP
jgi:hypothetical protein